MPFYFKEVVIVDDDEFRAAMSVRKCMQASMEGRKPSRENRESERILFRAIREYFELHRLRLTEKFPDFDGDSTTQTHC